MQSKDLCPGSLLCVFTVPGGQIRVLSRSVISAFDPQSQASGLSGSQARLVGTLALFTIQGPGHPWTHSVPKNDRELLIILLLPPRCCNYSCVLLVLCSAGDRSQGSLKARQAVYLLGHPTTPHPFLFLYCLLPWFGCGSFKSVLLCKVQRKAFALCS